MAIQVVHGAMLMCTMSCGTPSMLTVTPENRVSSGGRPAANIKDAVPMKNIMPFPLCSAPANPTVIAATAAKAGVATPAACVPATAIWAPGAPNVLLGYLPALDDTSKCQCAFGGTISVTFAGQVAELIP
ncbi:MAG: DUF4280 domain-containing protein [Lysobacteraceae bacterium]|nr:MAG: DUF4280 domain-containing protein [Xanthomonadaceae bacterium]